MVVQMVRCLDMIPCSAVAEYAVRSSCVLKWEGQYYPRLFRGRCIYA